jgi:hypothetical protein
VAAGRSRDGSLVLLALGCLAVGFLMLGHGLTTPGTSQKVTISLPWASWGNSR